MKPTDFIVEHNPFIAQDANEMHQDHEVQMARADCYNAADYAIKLHKILQGVKETGQLEGWVSEKITLANDYLRTVYEYLNYETVEQETAPMPAFESAENKFNQLIAEGHADQQRKIVKKNGRPVGEVGIDRESSPGNGQWYMKCYANGIDNSGYDSMAEALEELKHCLKTGVAESADAGGTSASSFATGPVADAVPVQRRVKQESAAVKKYGNAMKTKQPKIGKGVY